MTITFRAYSNDDLADILRLCAAEGWPSYPSDPTRASRVLSAPGVTTIVACDVKRVVAFAQLLSDGEIQAHLSLIAVDKAYRRRGIGHELITRAVRKAGGERVDLVTDTAPEFYMAFPHRRMEGFRIYPAPIGRDDD